MVYFFQRITELFSILWTDTFQQVKLDGLKSLKTVMIMHADNPQYIQL